MNTVYGRDLDLNLLRVFVVVAESGSVTAAAQKLYVTQPAVSAALRRLHEAVGSPVFVREGRQLVLSARGRALLARVQPALRALVDDVLSPGEFEPARSDRTLRLGLSDSSESWLLPPLLRSLRETAPLMRIVVSQVQFRTVEAALTSHAVDVAFTVADELPSSILRKPTFTGGFVCLYDPRHVKMARKLSQSAYLEHAHVIVSYGGDLRGIIEDMFGVHRNVKVSVPSFQSVGPVVDGTALLATVPEVVASDILRLRPHLRTAALPFALEGTSIDLLWRASADDDDAVRFLRDQILETVRLVTATTRPPRARGVEVSKQRGALR